MSPRRIQSAAGITTPPFRSPFFPTVSGSPFSPRSALLRPGPRRQGIGFASLRALDRYGPGRGAGSTTRKKGGVWRVSPLEITTARCRCLAFHGTARFPRFLVASQASHAPDRGKPLAFGICHAGVLELALAPRNRAARYSLLTLPRWFPLIHR